MIVGVLKTGKGVVDGEGKSIPQGGAKATGVKTWGMVYWPEGSRGTSKGRSIQVFEPA